MASAGRGVAELVNAGMDRWLAGDAAEAERLHLEAHALAPRDVAVLVNLSALRNDAGDVEGALGWLDRALAINPRHPELTWRRGLQELALGDYARGWAHYEAGLGQPGMRGAGPGFRTPPWNGEPCDRLLLWHEQGFGDTLQFVRYAQHCRTRARRVKVLCPPELARLLAHCPLIDAVVESADPRDFDQHASIMSLPAIFGTTLETVPAPIPYLFADADEAGHWKRRLGARHPKVGICWAGHFRREQRFSVIDRKRSLALQQVAPWLDVPGIEFVSLQKREPGAPPLPAGMADAMDEARDFAATAAIIANLDLVVSVDTAVAHLAGAMGKPVWVLSRHDACWRWLRNRETSPWYPTARVFGQEVPGSWDGVIARVRQALAALR